MDERERILDDDAAFAALIEELANGEGQEWPADPQMREQVSNARALSIDVGLLLRDAAPEVDVDRMVAQAMTLYSPPISEQSFRRALIVSGVLGVLLALVSVVLLDVDRIVSMSFFGKVFVDEIASLLPSIFGRSEVFVIPLLGVALVGVGLYLSRRLWAHVAVLLTLGAMAQGGHAQQTDDLQVTVRARSESVHAVVQRICRANRVQFVDTCLADQQVSLDVRNVPFDTFVDMVIPHSCTAKREGALLRISPAGDVAVAPAAVDDDEDDEAEDNEAEDNEAEDEADNEAEDDEAEDDDDSPGRQDRDDPEAIVENAVEELEATLRRAGENLDRAGHRNAEAGDRVVHVMGGEASVAASEVVERVSVWGGDAVVAGTVKKDVVLWGGDLAVESTAVIEGNVVQYGGDLNIEDGARIAGQVRVLGGDLNDDRDGTERSANVRIDVSRDDDDDDEDDDDGHVAGVFGGGLSAVMLFLAGVLLLRFDRSRAMTIARALMKQPAKSAVYGFTSLLGVLISVAVLAITLIGIPAALLLGSAVGLAVITGMAVIAFLIGASVASTKKEQPLTQLGIGVAILWVAWMIPALGALVVFATVCLGLGAVLLTKGGAQDAA